MKAYDRYRKAVLEKIAPHGGYTKNGRVTYKIDGKHYHIRVDGGQLPKYRFNINPTVLAADYEVYVCGTDDLYYLIPVELIRKMNSDPTAWPDHRNPGYTDIDVYPGDDIIKYGRSGKTLKIGQYRNTTV